MSSEINIYLPGNVQFKNVCTVISKALGFPSEWKETESKQVKWFECDGIEYTFTSMPEMLFIKFKYKDREYPGFYFHEVEDHGGKLVTFQFREEQTKQLIMTIGEKLVDFFGGRLQYDEKKEYYVPFKPNYLNCPGNGKDWDHLQQRMSEIKGIV